MGIKRMKNKLTRGQKAAATRKANQRKASREAAIKLGLIKIKNIKDPWEVSEYKVGDTLKIKLPNDDFKLDIIGSTMTSLEQAIDQLIQRINTQTQRIKDMI